MGEATHAKSHAWLWTIAVIIALPLLYVLSIGPMIYLTKKGYLPESIADKMETFYQPLGWLADHTSLVGEPLDAYAGWWEEL